MVWGQFVILSRMSFAPANSTVAFRCRQCGACCRWPGPVRLQSHEIEVLARFLKLSAAEFTAHYTRLLPDRTGLCLTETTPGACVFLSANLCRVHAVKPRQCRDFPEQWNFPGYETECQARRVML